MAAPVGPIQEAKAVPITNIRAQENAAGNRVQRPEQDDERDVIGHQDVKNFIDGRSPEDPQEGEGHAGGPKKGNLAEMMMPETGQEQRQQGDGKKHAGKRQAAPKGQGFTQVGMAVIGRDGGFGEQEEHDPH